MLLHTCIAYCLHHDVQVGVSNYGAKELRRVARDFEKRGVRLASAQVRRLTAY
jgi:hypothetical protein